MAGHAVGPLGYGYRLGYPERWWVFLLLLHLSTVAFLAADHDLLMKMKNPFGMPLPRPPGA